jgi:hypothetical protein
VGGGGITPRRSRKPVELFLSYAHANAVWFDRLRPVTKFHDCKDRAFVWNDQQMKAGDKWDKEIRDALERMDVFVCVVTFEFLSSGYIRDVELKRALERAETENVAIVPILIYPEIDLKDECPELAEINPLPDWGKCWRDFEQDGGHYQDAHGLIRRGLRQVINKVRGR